MTFAALISECRLALEADAPFDPSKRIYPPSDRAPAKPEKVGSKRVHFSGGIPGLEAELERRRQQQKK
jgi:hypothetical protein